LIGRQSAACNGRPRLGLPQRTGIVRFRQPLLRLPVSAGVSPASDDPAWSWPPVRRMRQACSAVRRVA